MKCYLVYRFLFLFEILTNRGEDEMGVLWTQWAHVVCKLKQRFCSKQKGLIESQKGNELQKMYVLMHICIPRKQGNLKNNTKKIKI